MMPPHVTAFEPPDGAIHPSNTLRIRGYSLEYAGEEPRLVDLSDGATVPYASELVETVLDRGTGHPGSVQVRGELSIQAALVAGRRYRLTFLGDAVEFTRG